MSNNELICPFCKEKMVRGRIEMADGTWQEVWLCGCVGEDENIMYESSHIVTEVPQRDSTLKIGPMTFTFTRVPGLKDDGKALWGHVIHQEGRIEVEARNCPQVIYHTTWHEVVHVIFEQAGRKELAKDEEVIDLLATGIMQVLQDNPWIAEAPK